MFNSGVQTVNWSTKFAAPDVFDFGLSGRTLIVCYGNPLRGDDGLAWQVASLLRVKLHDERIELICRFQLTPELAEEMSRSARVLFVDACVEGSPGDIRWSPIVLDHRAENDASAAPFTHQLTPQSLLAVCSSLYGRHPETIEVTICGNTFSLSEELSAVVHASVHKAVEDIARWTIKPIISRKRPPENDLSI